MERHCTKNKCDKCGSIMQVLSGRNVGAPEPTMFERIEAYKKRAVTENKEFTVVLHYEGEATRSYAFGSKLHEQCGGHYQAIHDVNLNELAVNQNRA